MEIIRQKLQSAIRDLYSLEASPDITPAPGNISADYSSNIALKLAKELHKAPMDIAGEIASYLTADNNMSFQNSPEPLLVNVSSPGFLNITVQPHSSPRKSLAWRQILPVIYHPANIPARPSFVSSATQILSKFSTLAISILVL